MPKDTVSHHRIQIDRIDAKIVKLLNERAKIALKIGQTKRQNKRQAYAPEREQQILNRLARQNKGAFPEHALKNVYREILSACRSLQSPLHVSYLGPEATFTHGAALKQFGQSTQMTPQPTIGAVFEAVESGEAEYGVVPIENSTEGIVTHTVDCLLESPLKICGETLLEIAHCLLGQKKGITPQQIYSHSQATAQCRQWLEKHYPHVTITETTSTARAAQLAGQDPESYAIGSELAAKQYGLKVLRRRIEDHQNNMTRFLVLGTESPKKTIHDKTSLAFSVRDEPGILHKMLEPFSRAGINLSKIESRPMIRLDTGKSKALRKRGRWEYVFFLDLDGHIRSPKVQKAIAQLEERCLFLKILGSYPRGK